MTEESAVTRIHDMREVNAKQWYEIDPKSDDRPHAGTRTSSTPILIVDHERKHSVSTIEARDPEQSARRDMMVFSPGRSPCPTMCRSSTTRLFPHELAMAIDLPDLRL